MINSKENYEKEELEVILLPVHRLTQKNWVQERGANIYKEFYDPVDNKVKAIERVVYEWGSDHRFPTNFYKQIEWYDNDGELYHSREVKREQVNQSKLDEVNSSIAKRRIKYLENAAIGLRKQAENLPEPYKTQYITVANSIDLLFSHYRLEVSDYILRQSMAFENAVMNETDPAILGILAFPARQPDEFFPNGLTVKQSIVHQLTKAIP